MDIGEIRKMDLMSFLSSQKGVYGYGWFDFKSLSFLLGKPETTIIRELDDHSDEIEIGYHSVLLDNNNVGWENIYRYKEKPLFKIKRRGE